MSAQGTLAERVQRERTARGLSREVLGVRSGTSASTIHRIEKGYQPRLPTIERIAAEFGMTVSELLDFNGAVDTNGNGQPVRRRRKESAA